MRLASARAASFLMIVSCSGCTSISTLHTARPLPVGATELVFAPGVYGFRDEDTSEYLPFFEAGVRRGFGERVDAGLRTTSFSTLSADLNLALYLGERFALSFDPTVSVAGLIGTSDFLITFLWLPILADVYASEDFTLTVGVKPGFVSVESDLGDLGFSESTELLGLGLGARWRVNDALIVLPEANLILFQDDDLDDERVWSFTLGFVL